MYASAFSISIQKDMLL